MQPVAAKLSFGDIIDKNKMIDQLRQSGKMHVKVVFHFDSKNKAQKTMWCDQNQPLLRLSRVIRQFFRVSENDGLFYYINRKIPDINKPLKVIHQLSGGGDSLIIDAATSQIF